MAVAASGVAAASSSPLSRAARAIGLWVLTLALPFGRQLVLHSKLSDTAADPSFDPSSPSSRLFFGKPQMASSLRNATGVSAAGNRPTVGVAVTVTGCDPDFPLDGAAVLRYSLLRHASERYSYKFYAIHHPLARDCVRPLAEAGYVLLERETPVNVSSIAGKYLRERMPKSGCCGERELIKFEALRLTHHPAVILLDMDMLVLKSLDDLIDMIVHNNPHSAHASRHLMPSAITSRGTKDQTNFRSTSASSGGGGSSSSTTSSSSSDVWLLYVSDYQMAKEHAEIRPSQGGFAVLKPNLTIYRDIKRIVLNGDYDRWNGWKDSSSGMSTGIFWGAATFQGLLPFYYQILNPGHAWPLDWCLHNNMNSPRDKRLRTKNGTTVDYCLNPTCQDCRDYSIHDVYSVHFTNCLKPWTCQPHGGHNPKQALCRGMHEAWFEHRSAMEVSWGRPGRGSGSLADPALRGYCSSYGKSGYEPIRQPYGAITLLQ